jgi:hypothetical protein
MAFMRSFTAGMKEEEKEVRMLHLYLSWRNDPNKNLREGVL